MCWVGAAVDVDWWVIVVPSVITGAVTAIGVTWTNMVAQRNNRRDAELRESMVLSTDPETRRLGENMLRSAVDNPGRRDKDVQRKIVAFWIDRLNPGLTSYNDGDDFQIDPGTEA